MSFMSRTQSLCQRLLQIRKGFVTGYTKGLGRACILQNVNAADIYSEKLTEHEYVYHFANGDINVICSMSVDRRKATIHDVLMIQKVMLYDPNASQSVL